MFQGTGDFGQFEFGCVESVSFVFCQDFSIMLFHKCGFHSEFGQLCKDILFPFHKRCVMKDECFHIVVSRCVNLFCWFVPNFPDCLFLFSFVGRSKQCYQDTS